MESEPETVEETPQLFLPHITVDTTFQPHTAAVPAQVLGAYNTYAAHMAVLSPSARAAALDVESRRIGEQFATLRSHAESYDVDLRAILGRASAQANIIHSGDQTESPAPPPGPSPRPSPAAQPPPAATGGPQTSQEHQQTLLDAMARVLDGAAPVGCTVGGSEYTTPAARPPPPVRAAALGEAACQFVSPHAAPPVARIVAPHVPLGGGLQFGPQGNPLGPQPSRPHAADAASAGAAHAAAALQGAAPGIFTADQMAQLVGQLTQALQHSANLDNRPAATRPHLLGNLTTSSLGGSRGNPTERHSTLGTTSTASSSSLGDRRFLAKHARKGTRAEPCV